MQTAQNVARLPALQYNFGANWFSEVKPILSRPEVAREFEQRLEQYIAMITSGYEDGYLGEGESARKLHLSQVLAAEAQYQDLHWLRDNYESYELSCLALVIAEALRPGEGWDILEGRETDHCVVTNPLRTQVFDMKLFDRVSGDESLVHAGDAPARPNLDDRRLQAYIGGEIAKHEFAIQRMQEHLASSPDDLTTPSSES